ncbi:MAG: MFS transporter [Solirubrobacteraceae bacterium]|nr:MFS transporter [Solirubrobacteraceae bacterium]
MADRARVSPGSIRTNPAGAAFAAALLFLVALNLRPALTTVGPLLPQIGAGEGIDEGTQGLLGALPLLAFGFASLLVPRLSARFGPERAVLFALLALGAGILVRSFTGHAGLWIGTVVLGAAIAIGNVVVPALVKREYPGSMVRATGIYSSCLALSAGIGAAIAVPIADATDWQRSLAVWAIPAFLVAGLWWPRARGSGRISEGSAKVAETTGSAAHRDPSDASERLDPSAPAHRLDPSVARAASQTVWRQPTAWVLTAYMGLQSTCFYVLITWLPTIEVAAGVPDHRTGLHMLAFQVVGVIAGLSIPRLMRRPDSQIAATIASSGATLVGTLGLLAMPSASLLWIMVAGLGTGSSLVVALSLISMRGRTHDEVTRLSGMAQSLGYLFAAAGPVAAGTLAESTGSWDATLVMVAALSATQLGVGVVAGRDRRPPVVRVA